MSIGTLPRARKHLLQQGICTFDLAMCTDCVAATLLSLYLTVTDPEEIAILGLASIVAQQPFWILSPLTDDKQWQWPNITHGHGRAGTKQDDCTIEGKA
jgi:hypothetical protein